MTTPPNPKAPKARVDFYVYADDLNVINTVFDMARNGKAIAGRRMSLTKTEWVREVLREAVERDLRQHYERIMKVAEPESGSD